MPIYRIADIDVRIDPKYAQTAKRLEPYICSSEKRDFEICLTDDEIHARSVQSENPCTAYEAESVLILSSFCNKVLAEYNGFFFHSSSLMLDDEGYVFSAKSGTGKSTHTRLWREHFGSRVTMINDDKPVIRKADNEFFIYGTPWMGKADIGNNVKAPIKAVYILRRGNENSAHKAKASEVIKDLLEATVISAERDQLAKLLALLDEFVSRIPVYILNCKPDIEAVKTAYKIANENYNSKKEY